MSHVVAYARRLGLAGVVVVPGRLFASLGLDVGGAPLGAAAWGDTAVDLSFIPAGTRLENLLTGETLAPGVVLELGRALAYFPGALLAYGTGPPDAETDVNETLQLLNPAHWNPATLTGLRVVVIVVAA